MNTITHRVLGAAVLVVMVLAAACGTGSSSDTSAPTVVLVTYTSFALDKKVKASVETEIGAKIEIRQSGDAGAALSKAILTAGRPEGDVFFGVDNTLLTRALDAEVFDTYTPTALSEVPREFDIDPSHHLVPIDSGAVCVNYDKKWFTDRQMKPPGSFEDLADPAYKNLLVVENPVTSSPGLVFLMATHTHFGTSTDDFWRALARNGVTVSGSWDDAWETRYSVNGGDRPLVVSYASSPPAEVFYSDGKLAEPASAVAVSTCARQIEMAGVLRGAPHRDLAHRLVEAMLSEQWQAALPLTNFVDPVRSGVELPALYERFAAQPPAPIVIAPDQAGAQRDAWIDAWRSIME